MLRSSLIVACAVAGLTCLFTAATVRADTTVRFTSNVGSFDVLLTDSVTPVTVANFLSYVNSGAYNNTFIHRSVPGLVIQGGGYDNAGGLPAIPTGAPIVNEFALAQAARGGGPVNVRGTIAMAKLSGDPNSATSQFFLNLADNSANLDTQNGGFCVFGTVVSGMSTVDGIAGLPRVNAGGPFTDVPLAGDGTATLSNLVTFSSVAVVPEPGMVGVMGAIAVGVVGRRRR